MIQQVIKYVWKTGLEAIAQSIAKPRVMTLQDTTVATMQQGRRFAGYTGTRTTVHHTVNLKTMCLMDTSPATT